MKAVHRDDQGLARACRILLAGVRLERLWTAEGPTAKARELLASNGGPLTQGERTVLLIAWTFWNGSARAALAKELEQLPVEPLEALRLLVKLSTSCSEDGLAGKGN